MSEPTSATTDALSLLFHENSKIHSSDERFGRRLAAFVGDRRIQEMVARPFKRYRGAPRLALPSPLAGGRGTSLAAALAARRSAAHLGGGRLDLATLSRLLWSGAGVVLCSGVRPGAPRVLLRCTPSAGALYPLETYLVALDVAGVEPGLHHYDPPAHELERVAAGDLAAGVARAVPREVGGAAAVVVLTALFRRSLAKYGERGYRFALMEAGHAAQNMLLVAAAAGLPAVPVGGFLDDEVSLLLGVDGVDEAPLYLLVVGGDRASSGARERGG